MRLLKLDPRPPAYDSVLEAALEDDATSVVDAGVELAEWCAVTPPPVTSTLRLAFVDGVQQIEARVSAEGEGWPIRGIIASYAAGAICSSPETSARHLRIGRQIILSNGKRPPAIRIEAGSGAFEYTPSSSSGDDPTGPDMKLGELRAQLEAEVVRAVLAEGVDLVVVDGRLPPVTEPNAVGMIKTMHRMPVTADEHIDVVLRLTTGQRSPVFLRQRSARKYYTWFVCLRTPSARDLSPSGLVLIEMDDAAPAAEAFRVADLTAALLPAYASTPARDDRAPQNLLPVGQLERHLRHRLGDRELLRRLLLRAFAREEPAWQN